MNNLKNLLNNNEPTSLVLPRIQSLQIDDNQGPGLSATAAQTSTEDQVMAEAQPAAFNMFDLFEEQINKLKGKMQILRNSGEYVKFAELAAALASLQASKAQLEAPVLSAGNINNGTNVAVKINVPRNKIPVFNFNDWKENDSFQPIVTNDVATGNINNKCLSYQDFTPGI